MLGETIIDRLHLRDHLNDLNIQYWQDHGYIQEVRMIWTREGRVINHIGGVRDQDIAFVTGLRLTYDNPTYHKYHEGEIGGLAEAQVCYRPRAAEMKASALPEFSNSGQDSLLVPASKKLRVRPSYLSVSYRIYPWFFQDNGITPPAKLGARTAIVNLENYPHNMAVPLDVLTPLPDEEVEEAMRTQLEELFQGIQKDGLLPRDILAKSCPKTS